MSDEENVISKCVHCWRRRFEPLQRETLKFPSDCYLP